MEISTDLEHELTAIIIGHAAQLDQLVGIASAANSTAVSKAVQIGEALERAFHQLPGRYEAWLKTRLLKPDGTPLMSHVTAISYRKMWLGRDLIFPPDGSLPPPKNITAALQRIGVLPAPLRIEGDDSDFIAPVFRLKFSTKQEPEKWTETERQSFMGDAKEVVELYRKCEALQAAK